MYILLSLTFVLYHKYTRFATGFWWCCTRKFRGPTVRKRRDHRPQQKPVIVRISEYEDSEGETGFNVRILPNLVKTCGQV